MQESRKQARKRAEVIIKVQSGQMTIAEATKELGISRKTYYKWETRGLEALLGAVSDRSPGRPVRPVDPEKEAMERSLAETERQLHLAEQRAEIRDYFISEEDLTMMDRMREILQKKKRFAGKDREANGSSQDH